MNNFYINNLKNKGFTDDEIKILNKKYYKKCLASELALIIDDEKEYIYLIEDMIKVKVYDYEVYTDALITYNLFENDEYIYIFNIPTLQQTIIQDILENKKEFTTYEEEKIIKIIGGLINELFE